MSQKLLSKPVVYFIRGKLTNRIKIGKTCSLIEDRLNQLQTGSPDELEFLGGYFGTDLDEAVIHEMFKSSRLHGEWFESSDELVNFIGTKCIHSSIAIYCALTDIESGLLTYNQAMELGDDALAERARKHLSNAASAAF